MINAFPPYKLPNMPIRQGDSSLPSWSINYSTPAGAARPAPNLLPTSSSTASHCPLTTWAITAPPIASCTTIPVADVFYYLYLYPPPLEKITECNCKNMQCPTYQSGRRGGVLPYPRAPIRAINSTQQSAGLRCRWTTGRDHLFYPSFGFNQLGIAKTSERGGRR